MIPTNWLTPSHGVPGLSVPVDLGWRHVVLTLEPGPRVTRTLALGSWLDALVSTESIEGFSTELRRRVSVAGVVVDASIGLPLVSVAVDHARLAWPRLPALVLVGDDVRETRLRVDSLGALALDRRLPTADLQARILQFVSTVHSERARLVTHVEILAGRYALTPRETSLLALLALGVRRRQLAERLSIGDETVKSMVRSILGKTGAERLSEVPQRLASLRR